MEDGIGNYGISTTCKYQEPACYKLVTSEHTIIAVHTTYKMSMTSTSKIPFLEIGRREVRITRSCIDGSFLNDGCWKPDKNMFFYRICICRTNNLCNNANHIALDNMKIILILAVVYYLLKWNKFLKVPLLFKSLKVYLTCNSRLWVGYAVNRSFTSLNPNIWFSMSSFFQM